MLVLLPIQWLITILLMTMLSGKMGTRLLIMGEMFLLQLQPLTMLPFKTSLMPWKRMSRKINSCRKIIVA
jgi:hypothetical protein